MVLMSKIGSGRMFRGGQDVAALFQVEGISHDATEALLASASASTRVHGSRSMTCFEDFSPGASAVRQFAHRLEMEDMGEDGADEYGFTQPEKKRRLSAKQVQFLEKSFETENRLEPERKLQLARELELQPRQVAIWFQNRRARWKTKQLEKDYEVLQSSFKTLKTDYDDLVKEMEKLQVEIQALTEMLLLQDKANGNPGLAEVPSLASSPPPMLPPTRSKLDDMCSGSSAIIDHNSQYTEEAWHSSADMPELDPSEPSQPEESAGERKLESASYDFKDDNPWFWSY